MNRAYTAPEYALHGHLSEKVDTYAYGVLVLEIISGRESTYMMTVNDRLLAYVSSLTLTFTSSATFEFIFHV